LAAGIVVAGGHVLAGPARRRRLAELGVVERRIETVIAPAA
jgi:hypothetical protein